MPIKTGFLSDLNAALARHAGTSPPILTEEAIADLPEPVQRYMRQCGFMGRPVCQNALIEYRDIQLKLWEGSNYAPIRALHYTSAPDLRRIVYIENRIFNFIPLDAHASYQAGQMNSYARLAWLFRPTIPTGQEQNESGMADLLSDALLVPGLALSPNIQWMDINEVTARAIFQHAGLEVSGIFRFNPAGECIEFDTEDKSYTMKDTSTVKVRNTMHFEGYREVNGVRQPARLHAFWHLATGDFEYAKGEYAAIRYNVSEGVRGF